MPHINSEIPDNSRRSILYKSAANAINRGIQSDDFIYKTANMSSLASVNNKIARAGQSFPEITLTDGTKVQTGTVGALLHNIRLYDALADNAVEEREQLERDIELAIPVLVKVGLFGLFGPDEWLAGTSKGRRFAGQMAKDMGV